MKKQSKSNVIKLLKLNKYTYKQLAIITGYHEKSLIRINSYLKKGLPQKKKRIPHNYIEDKIKQELIKNWQQKEFSSYKSYYLHLKSQGVNYSYSFLCKLLPKKKKKQKEIF